jgi:hypothetical protein
MLQSSSSQMVRQVLDRYLIVLTVVLLTHVVVLGVTRFQLRWLAPLMIPIPLWFLLRVPSELLNSVRKRWMSASVLLAGLIVFAGRAVCLRVDEADQQAHTALSQRTFVNGVVLTDELVLGGKCRLHFPQTRVFTWPPVPTTVPLPKDSEPLLLLWRETTNPGVPDHLIRLAAGRGKSLPLSSRDRAGHLRFLIVPPSEIEKAMKAKTARR